jgi:hypothetical protein
MYIDGRLATDTDGTAHSPANSTQSMIRNLGAMRLLACFIAAVVYVWQEQIVFLFSQVQLVMVMLGVGLLSLGLCFFRRGPSRFQPPEPLAGVLHFIGWHTLEIYVIQLAASELIIKFVPNLAA